MVGLRPILEALSEDTWQRLHDAHDLEVRFGEETITDLLLLDLRRRQPRSAEFVQTPKSKEAHSGTDFEWWLGSDRVGWVRFAVQSKRIDLRSGRYSGLNHAVAGVPQIDLLENYASKNDATPIYCLYNHRGNVVPSIHWHCCKYPCDKPQLGCTVTPSSVVRGTLSVHGVKNFHHIHSDQRTIPWRCLATCPRIRRWAGQAPGSGPIADGPAGESFPFGKTPRRYPTLPSSLRLARESRRIEQFDPEVFNPEAGRPRRILFMELGKEDERLS